MLSLSNVDFNYPGQMVFSELNLIYFNLLPFSGEVQFDRFNSKTIRANDLPKLRRKMGIIFQDFKLLNDRNIYENLSFILEAIGTTRKEIKRKVTSVLTDVGLLHRRFSFPNELSGGEKQRIAIARSIVNEPFLILADEPTGNLDPETSGEIVDLLFKINARGTAIIFATHNYEIVKKYHQKIVKIENGRAIKVVLKKKD